MTWWYHISSLSECCHTCRCILYTLMSGAYGVSLWDGWGRGKKSQYAHYKKLDYTTGLTLNLDKCALHPVSLCGEWKLKRRTWRHQRNQLHFFQWKQLKIAYAVIFAHKGKSNTSFGNCKGPTFICVHSQYQQNVCFYKINKTMMRFLTSRLEQERKSVNTCLTDMINISIESFKLATT